MSNREACGKKWIKKCDQALFIDVGALIVLNSASNSRYGHYFSLAGLFTYLRQLLCILPFVIEYHSAGSACGFHTKQFSKHFIGPVSRTQGMYGMLSEHSFYQNNNGEHIKMKFETGNLRSCTDEDYENAKYGMRAFTLFRQRSRLAIGGINAFLADTVSGLHHMNNHRGAERSGST